MKQSLLHTPDGVRDIYGRELLEKEYVASAIMNNIHSYGYRKIETPTIEFLDCFGNDIGTMPSNELFKLFDKEGNTLCLRPDFTPSIARCASKYFMEEDMPLRFCYEGSTFVNSSELQLKLKENSQLGMELINDGSVEADAEILFLVIEGLKAAGLNDFQISVGETNYFKGICEEAKLDEETELALKDSISSKNYFGTREFLKKQGFEDDFIRHFDAISKLFVSTTDLKQLAQEVTNDRSKLAIERLISIREILKKKGYDKYVSFDLSMLSKYHYYTGIIFNAYTYKVGEAVAKGGRYDGLLEKFGKAAPSIGCVFFAGEIQNALRRQQIEIPNHQKESVLLLYQPSEFDHALKTSQDLRSEGINVTMMKKEKPIEIYERYLSEHGYQRLIEL